MYAELGLGVLAADLDPQANLTTMFLDEDRLAVLWPEGPSQASPSPLLPLLKGKEAAPPQAKDQARAWYDLALSG
nr:hypothetical protein [Deltaproteobacteria bacterium]